jgi:endonuclease/exonuclease/phosphatase family metal-dependent hydrolase
VLFPIMGLSVSSSRSASQPVRIASYNVFWGHGDRTKLFDEIAAMPVDIFVSQASFGSMGEKLKERFPDRNVRQEGELLIMTRFPIRKVDVPPALPDQTDVLFVKYVVETPAGDLRIYNVHPFSPRHALFADEETAANITHREQQIAAAVAAARSDVPPFIIIGDTNLPPLSSIARRHFDGLKDAFDEVGFGFGYTFPARRPWMRIDRALGSDGVRFLDVRVAPRGISDHRTLFVDLELMGEH